MLANFRVPGVDVQSAGITYHGAHGVPAESISVPLGHVAAHHVTDGPVLPCDDGFLRVTDGAFGDEGPFGPLQGDHRPHGSIHPEWTTE